MKHPIMICLPNGFFYCCQEKNFRRIISTYLSKSTVNPSFWMIGFFWNVRGFNKSSKHGVVRSWVQNKELQFGCLLETRVKENKAKQIVSSIFNG